jgi:hypothetical protein
LTLSRHRPKSFRLAPPAPQVRQGKRHNLDAQLDDIPAG